MTPSRQTCGSSTLRLELWPMFDQVLTPASQSQILNAVIERVAVDVVNDHPRRDRAVCLLPNKTSAQLPHVGLCHLDESPRFVVPLVTNPDLHRPNRDVVDGLIARRKRPRMRRTSTLVLKIAARHRAVGRDASTTDERVATVGAGVICHTHILTANAGTYTPNEVAS